MSIDLVPPIGAYYAAKNRQDVDAMVALFADDAIVLDEGKERQGQPAIREWMNNTTRKLSVQSQITQARSEEGREIVTAIVSGDFKGSPVTLDYAFTLRNGLIARLEIA